MESKGRDVEGSLLRWNCYRDVQTGLFIVNYGISIEA